MMRNVSYVSIMRNVCHFQSKGDVLLCDDLNARTGVDPGTVDTQVDKYISNDKHHLPTFHLRNNYDKLINKTEKWFDDECKKHREKNSEVFLI